MAEHSLEQLLTEGGKANSLGRVNDVIALVLDDKKLLDELYGCMRHENPWVRMRGADAFEKICRIHPDWISPYIPSIQQELSGDDQQASIKWHIAEIYSQVTLKEAERVFAINWLSEQLATTNVDWIVAANCMKTLLTFTNQGHFPVQDLRRLLEIQKTHNSKSIVRKAAAISDSI